MFKLADCDCKVSCSSLLACLRAWRCVRKLSGQAEGGKTLTEIPCLPKTSVLSHGYWKDFIKISLRIYRKLKDAILARLHARVSQTSYVPLCLCRKYI